MGSSPGAQGTAARSPFQNSDEVVANLAAGRVAVLVGKDGIAVATAESAVEPGTLPPLIVPLSSLRVGVLLGPVEWTSPESNRPPIRLDAELMRGAVGFENRGTNNYETPATDVEGIGLGFLEPLRGVAGRLHNSLHLAPNALFAELLLVDYARGYGPEVWSLRYHVEQQLLRGDFYRTSVHRPEYVQLYPPDKGQPKTLLETRYPPDDASDPPILDLMKASDNRVAVIRNADPALEKAADLLARGESPKIRIDDGLGFLRAAFQNVSPHDARQMIVVIREQEGIEWITGEKTLAPPPTQPGDKPAAPSLHRKPGGS